LLVMTILVKELKNLSPNFDIIGNLYAIKVIFQMQISLNVQSSMLNDLTNFYCAGMGSRAQTAKIKINKN
jgi:hypothetical protein